MAAAVDRLLERLAGAKQTGPGRWVARCPAHDDRSPSLSLRELADGRVLVHCFGGCSALEVVSAVDLTMADLFEKPLGNLPPLRPRERWDRGDVWQLLAHESAVAAIAAADIAAGRAVSAEDAERAGLAADRLADAIVALGVSR
ncbi:MAG TPA: hypothetical protein VHN38_06330 [Immundisolibacter sp.]|nr:hypothetical protein [Immundisolibacter sp.]